MIPGHRRAPGFVRNFAHGTILIACLCAGSTLLARQQPANGSPSQASNAGDKSATDTGGQQEAVKKKDDRLFGILPNYFTVEGASDSRPLTAKEKFKITAESAFDPVEFGVVGVLAGFNQAENQDKSFGQGAMGYAKRYGVGFADQGVGNLMTGAVFPGVTARRSPLLPVGQRRLLRHRFDHALARTFVTPTDSGAKRFNYSEFLGNAAAAGISNAYIPRTERTLDNTGTTFAEQIAVDMLGFEVKEFWPGSSLPRNYAQKELNRPARSLDFSPAWRTAEWIAKRIRLHLEPPI